MVEIWFLNDDLKASLVDELINISALFVIYDSEKFSPPFSFMAD